MTNAVQFPLILLVHPRIIRILTQGKEERVKINNGKYKYWSDYFTEWDFGPDSSLKPSLQSFSFSIKLWDQQWESQSKLWKLNMKKSKSFSFSSFSSFSSSIHQLVKVSSKYYRFNYYLLRQIKMNYYPKTSHFVIICHFRICFQAVL